jgi:acetylornithine deacetylase
MRAVHDGADIDMEQIYAYPALDTAADHPAVRLVKALVGRNDDGKVAFGTEGGHFSQKLGIPTVVCGPGSIGQAHKPDEFVTRDQIARCHAFVSRLIDWSAGDGPTITP